MKQIVLMIVLIISSIGISQETEDSPKLNIEGSMRFMNVKKSMIFVFEGDTIGTDTIQKIHVTKRKGKFNIPELDARKGYTLLFKNGDALKRVFITSLSENVVDLQIIYFSVDWEILLYTDGTESTIIITDDYRMKVYFN